MATKMLNLGKIQQRIAKNESNIVRITVNSEENLRKS